jgi:hypothetical protein
MWLRTPGSTMDVLGGKGCVLRVGDVDGGERGGTSCLVRGTLFE